MRFQHTTPPFRTFCGSDALDSLPRELDRVGATRAVVVCDGAIAQLHAAALERVEGYIGERLVGRFDAVEEHSPIHSVQAAAALLAEVQAEAVIVVGGGSSVVTARAATILHGEQQDVRALCTQRDADGRLVSPRLRAAKLPQWIVPSTPTSAYAKAGAAVRDPETGERLALFDPKARAQGVFLDPGMALTAPAGLVLSSGLNSFSMAIESLQATTDPLAVALLGHALQTLAECLTAPAEGDDADRRLRIMAAALLCGQGSDYAGGGLAQALSHAAGPRSSTSNGIVEAMLLPATIRWNAPVAGAQLPSILYALGLGADAGGDVVERAVGAVEQVLRALGVPARLRDVGLERDALGDVVDHTLDDWAVTRVPRQVDGDALMTILESSW